MVYLGHTVVYDTVRNYVNTVPMDLTNAVHIGINHIAEDIVFTS